jgi:hypothetical protein
MISQPTEYSGITLGELLALANNVGLPTSRDLSNFFGVKDTIVRRWLNGERGVPISVVMTLELMRHYQLTPEQVREITGEST